MFVEIVVHGRQVLFFVALFASPEYTLSENASANSLLAMTSRDPDPFILLPEAPNKSVLSRYFTCTHSTSALISSPRLYPPLPKRAPYSRRLDTWSALFHGTMPDQTPAPIAAVQTDMSDLGGNIDINLVDTRLQRYAYPFPVTRTPEA
ncbi:hypothetical protein M7I_0784 [Glarea lozoyensis 74030]|uniref:Uncharacterized protein n=1 Tax=Glarea lozoyensis (strain ATCC 74030 / MF5533) TaxID=1104152 RepID=H0EEB0_GLAL7|nr:hypothetical protein M7I_0784 [Glarea lozoyensis 74030]